MFAIVAGCVPPASMRVHRTGLGAVELEAPVCLVRLPGAALAFEIVNNVRHRVALEQVALDEKRKRSEVSRCRNALQVISALGGEGVEIESPEIPVAPLLDRSGGFGRQRQHRLARGVVFQGAIRGAIARVPEY